MTIMSFEEYRELYKRHNCLYSESYNHKTMAMTINIPKNKEMSIEIGEQLMKELRYPESLDVSIGEGILIAGSLFGNGKTKTITKLEGKTMILDDELAREILNKLSYDLTDVSSVILSDIDMYDNLSGRMARIILDQLNFNKESNVIRINDKVYIDREV